MSDTPTLKPVANAFYYYKPRTNWCNHGILRTAEIYGELVGCDTYWTGGTGVHGYGANGEPQPIAKFQLTELVGMVEDFEVIRHPEQWDWFEEKDRLYIPVGGGSARSLIRKNATPNVKLVIEWHRNQIEREESKAKWALKNADQLKTALLEWEAKL